MDKLKHTLLQSLSAINTDFDNSDLNTLLKSEGITLNEKPIMVHIESSKSLEEPLSLNSRIINLGRTQTVTLLACKVIYNAYRENDLTTLIRVGIIPNYTDLLDATLELLELLRMFIAGLEHPIDIQYINTPGMTMKEYRKLLTDYSGDRTKCETLIRALKLNDNYALYTLHYNLLSGSTIIQEPTKFVESARMASERLIEHLNTTSRDVDVKVILTRYHTLKTTYEEIIKLKKDTIADKINSTFNKSSKLTTLISHMEESYHDRVEKLSKIESVITTLDQTRQSELLTHLHKLYEQQFTEYQRLSSGTEVAILNKSLQTLALYEKNYTVTRENLTKLKDTLSKLVVSSDTLGNTGVMEEVVTNVKTLLETQKNYQDTIANLKHLANELVEISCVDAEDE